mgnify:CR=1 FL=1
MAASTDDSDAFSPSATCHLSEKGKFATWKSEVELLAYSKGMGGVGAHLFEEDGGDVSYDAQSAVIKKKWMSTMKKLYGVVGATIKIDEVKQAWTQAWDDHFHDEEDSPYALYYCMKAAEELCIKHDQISKDIKTKEFLLALGSFNADEGFVPYAQRVRKSIRDFNTWKVDMSDEQQKLSFFTYFANVPDSTAELSFGQGRAGVCSLACSYAAAWMADRSQWQLHRSYCAYGRLVATSHDSFEDRERRVLFADTHRERCAHHQV